MTWRHARSPSRRTRAACSLTVALSPNILHLPSEALARDWSGVALALGARTVTTVSDEETIAHGLDGATHHPADVLHVESEAAAALLKSNAPAWIGVEVIPPGPDPVLLREPASAPPAHTPLRVLSVGSLSWAQGYEHALYAVKLLREREIACEYRIAGQGEFRDAVSFARHQLGLDSCVELVEPRSRPEVRELFRWADVLLDASVATTSSKPLLDAHACGTPVVTTQPTARGDATLVVRRRDPEGLCSALEALAADPALRARLANAGRKHAAEESGEPERAARFGDLYRRLLERACRLGSS